MHRTILILDTIIFSKIIDKPASVRGKKPKKELGNSHGKRAGVASNTEPDLSFSTIYDRTELIFLLS